MSELTVSQPATASTQSSLNRIPVSTYRLQLGADHTLDQVRSLLPYLDKLGISDVYLSPLFRARKESSHGYDVVDHGAIDPAIGNLQTFARMAETATSMGMGVLLDVVPNHMGINDPGNSWWNDVLENGEGSYFADYFDIEWHPASGAMQNKVLLPFLGDPFGKVLENGELRLVYRERRLQLEYYERRFPVTPSSWPIALQLALDDDSLTTGDANVSTDRTELASIITQLRNLPPGTKNDSESMEQRYREQKIAARRLDQLTAASPAVRTALDHALEQMNGTPGDAKSFDRLEQLLDEQWYRLAYWRVAADEINYRRFFDVNDLAAIRVEDPRVFDAVHRLIARLLEAGWVTGLRIDHPDGLRDPLAYFKNLQTMYRTSQPSTNGASRDVYILAEKILSGEELLASDWPVSGTTGYDLLNVIGRVQVHLDGLSELRSAYDRDTDQDDKPADVVYESRRTVLLTTMASELSMLTAQLFRITRQHRASRDFTQPALQRALREVLASMTVYRTYARIDSWDITDADYRTVTTAVRMAKRRNRSMPFAMFDFIASILLLEHPPTITPEQAEDRRRFALKFQQVSGPVAAKGVEDTAFYRYYPLASLNEVGGELDAKPLAVDEFHRLMHHRRNLWPHSMSATSTHDSKRGEDMRARLHVLSEMPREWEQAFARWQTMNKTLRREVDSDTIPDANEEYLIYQTLVGTWPFETPQGDERTEYCDRILQYLEKALREAKIHTSWMNPSEAHETAIRDFITSLFAPEHQAFLDDVTSFVSQIADAGFVNSLSQLLLKVTLPGMPDFYRGTELWDFNLVDPDNRRPVDYESRKHRLKSLWSAAENDMPASARELAARWPDPDVKLWVTTSSLRCRRELCDVFALGEYIPLSVSGSGADHVLAFARRHESQIAICVVPRHFYRYQAAHPCVKTDSPVPAANWAGTKLILPADFPADWMCRISGNRYTSTNNPKAGTEGERELAIAELFSVLPVALVTQ
jgi:(1->4)-alpha-D-glucan 1-alpha-D-glucosylmutase